MRKHRYSELGPNKIVKNQEIAGLDDDDAETIPEPLQREMELDAWVWSLSGVKGVASC
jgi:hypothetical protein